MFEATTKRESGAQVLQDILTQEFKIPREIAESLPHDSTLLSAEFGFQAREMIYLLLLIEIKIGAKISSEELEKGFYTVGDIIRAIENTLNKGYPPAG